MGAIERIRNAQNAVLTNLLNSARFNRLVEQETLQGTTVYRPVDFLADVRKAVWRELEIPQIKIDAYRRNLQRAYLDLANAKINGNTVVPVGAPPALAGAFGASGDEKPFYRAELRALDRSIVAALPRTMDRETRAHLEAVRDQIVRILDPRFNPAPTGPGPGVPNRHGGVGSSDDGPGRRQNVLARLCDSAVAALRIAAQWSGERPLSASAAKNGDDVDHHACARRIHHDCPIDVASPVTARKHDELTLDCDGQRFHLLFPSRRKMPGSIKLFGEAGRQAPIPGDVGLADDSNILTAEVAGARVMVTLIVIIVPVVGLPMFVPRFAFFVRMFCESWRSGQRADEQNAEC